MFLINLESMFDQITADVRASHAAGTTPELAVLDGLLGAVSRHAATYDVPGDLIAEMLAKKLGETCGCPSHDAIPEVAPRQVPRYTRRARDAQALVDAWAHPVGTAVKVRRDDGEVFITTTRSVAMVMSNTPVIFVEGIRGAYALERVELYTGASTEKAPS